MNQEKQYFSNLRTVEEVKNHYRAIAKKYHPDLGGDEETMKEINSQYQAKLKNLDGYEGTKDNGDPFTYHYDETVETAVMEKLMETLKAGLPEGASVALIGIWLWVTGTARGDGSNKILKELKYKWHRDRECWYWAPYKHHGRRSGASLAGLAMKYGCRNFAADQYAKEAARTPSEKLLSA